MVSVNRVINKKPKASLLWVFKLMLEYNILDCYTFEMQIESVFNNSTYTNYS